MKTIKKAKFNKIAALAIIVSVSSSGIPTYAITSTNGISPDINTTNSQHYKNSVDIIGKLDSLVTLGKINQFQKAAVIKYLVTYKRSLPNLNISRLSTKPISKSQETLISNLFTSYKNSISKAIKDDFTYKLNKLIDLGTITQYQKKEIINSYTIYKASNDVALTFDNLVTNETITKDQENALISSFKNSKKSISKTINDILLSKLDKLIINGTISEGQRATVINLTKIPTLDSKSLNYIEDPYSCGGRHYN